MAETPLPSPPRGRCPNILEQNIDLEIQQNHQPTSPLPTLRQAQGRFGKGRAERAEAGGGIGQAVVPIITIIGVISKRTGKKKY